MMHPNAPEKSDLRRLRQPLSFSHPYPCPVCRYGQIEALFWVEAFSCGFCRHIFTMDLALQQLRLEDAAQPLTWKWTGNRWVSVYSSTMPDYAAPLLGALGAALVLVPTALIWLTNHIFPPLVGQGGELFPWLWTGLTFLAHTSIVAWFYLEYYQIPLSLILKLTLRRIFQPVFRS